MSASNNNRLATFELTEFNTNPQPKNDNTEKPQADYTGFNHADFASWAKSSTEKPFNQPQINVNKPKEDYTGFNHADFTSWAKSSTAKSSTEKEYKPFNQPQINADRQQRADNEWFDYAAFVTLAKSQVVQN